MKIEKFDVVEISNNRKAIVLDICKSNYRVRVISDDEKRDEVIIIKRKDIIKVLYH